MSYTVEGFLKGGSIFSGSGSVPPNQWFWAGSPSSATIDRLAISFVRGQAEAFFLDNIGVLAIPDQTVVPEPSTAATWLTLIASVGSLATWRRYAGRRSSRNPEGGGRHAFAGMASESYSSANYVPVSQNRTCHTVTEG